MTRSVDIQFPVERGAYRLVAMSPALGQAEIVLTWFESDLTWFESARGEAQSEKSLVPKGAASSSLATCKEGGGLRHDR